MCSEGGGVSSALYASFLDSPVFSSAGSTVKFARECNNSVFLAADLTHFFPFMKQHVHGDLELLITSCREVPWKLGRQTHRCDGAFQHFAWMKAKPFGSLQYSFPLDTAQSRWVPGDPPALRVGAWGLRRHRSQPLAAALSPSQAPAAPSQVQVQV